MTTKSSARVKRKADKAALQALAEATDAYMASFMKSGTVSKTATAAVVTAAMGARDAVKDSLARRK